MRGTLYIFWKELWIRRGNLTRLSRSTVWAMEPMRGKVAALKILAWGLAVLAVLGFSFTFRGPIVEEWRLWKLKSSEGTERQRVARQLGVPVLLELLRDKERPDYRLPAALALAEIEPETVIPVLIEMLKNDDYSGRSVALAGLSVHGPRAGDAVPALIELIKETSQQPVPGAGTTLNDINLLVLAGGQLTPWMESRILLTNAVSILAFNIKPEGIEPAAKEAITVLSDLLKEEEAISRSAARLLRKTHGG